VTSAAASFYWFDYETFGRSAVWDHPAQFAGRRTDLDLNPIGEPEVFYCKLPGDYLPEPGACRITGITPEKVTQEGLPQARFIERVVAQLGAPGTVSVGFNSVRFDDEFTRHTLFRNLMPPYEYEWRDGNSRWDLIDVVRLTRALRPEGIQWPFDEHGAPTNRLELLTQANGIEHSAAHDALSDVDATIGMARLLRDKQPRLFNFAFEHRRKASAATLLNVQERNIVLIASAMIPGSRHNLAAIVPICRDPKNSNAVIVLDLDTPPALLLELNTEELKRRVFSRRDQLGADIRIGLTSVKTNACPVLAPFKTLRAEDAERLDMDIADLQQRHNELKALLDSELLKKIEAVMTRAFDDSVPDVDGSLYVGGFLSDSDRRKLDSVRALTPDKLATARPLFDDARLDAMLWRYRARNWPESLSSDEQTQWREHISHRLSQSDERWLDWDAFDRAMTDADWTPGEATLKAALQQYRDELYHDALQRE
jgi:exodeoxyribonuclease-1